MRINTLVSSVVLLTGACASDHGVPRAGMIRDSLGAAAGATADVAITQFALGDWTELFIFSPYSSSEMILRCVGSRIDDAGIASRDDIDLLIFALPTVRRLVAPYRAALRASRLVRGTPRTAAPPSFASPLARWAHGQPWCRQPA